MTKRIRFQNVGVQFKNRVVFQNFSLDIVEGQDVCLIGQEGVGKTLLLKALSGKAFFSGEILKEAPVRGVFDFYEKVEGTISEYLEYSSLHEKDAMLVSRFLKLKTLQYSVSKLNPLFRFKVFLLKQLLYHPKFFFLDDVMNLFSKEEKQEIFSFLRDVGVTLFYVTSDMEDVLLFPYCVLMGANGVLMEGRTSLVLQEEKILKRLGFSMPFFVDLSLQLKSYELIDSVYLNGKELTNGLWKSN